MIERISGVVSLAVLVDVLANSAQLLTIAADVMLTPMILFAFTILPNLDGVVPPWVHDAFIFLVVVFGVIVLLNAAGKTIRRYREKNGN